MDELSIHERMFYHRAVDAVVWAMPLLNFKQIREGSRALGVDYNDIAYYSRIQDWRFQTATPNNTRPTIGSTLATHLPDRERITDHPRLSDSQSPTSSADAAAPTSSAWARVSVPK